MNTLAHPLGISTYDAKRRDLKPPLISEPFILATTITLVIFGLIMLYSTTGILSQEKFADPLYFVKRQGGAALIGLFFLAICSRVPVSLLQKISPALLPVCIVLLLLPLLPGIGDKAWGAHRWVQLPFVRFQPGEFVKVLFVIALAGYLSRHECKLKEFVAGVVKPIGMVALLGVLFLKQPDFGSTAVIVTVTLAMAAAAGMRFIYLGGAAALLSIAGAALVIISPYRLARISSFLSPWEDSSGKGYQLIQSLIAVGTGQLTGVGLGESQQKLFFLPAAHTDFLFAVVSEELGFIGAVSLIFLFVAFLWRGVKIAMASAEDTFLFTLTVGLTMLIVLPALLNVGVVIGLLPTKGLVLPLVGYGGSSLIASLGVVGLLLSCARSLHTGR